MQSNYLQDYTIKYLLHIRVVDSSRFYKIEHEKFKLKDPIQFITIGKLIKRKGYHHLFNTLNDTDINFNLSVIGQYKNDIHHKSGKDELREMKHLYDMGNELLGNKVTFLGGLENIEIHLHNSDIFLYWGLQDGTPNAVLEAMACGLPIIMFNNLPDQNLFIPGKTIEIFNTSEELKEKILFLMNNPAHARAIGDKAASIIAENYTFDKVTSKLIDQLNCKSARK